MNRPADRRPWTFFLLLGLTILILALHETGQLGLAEDLLSLIIGPVQRSLSGVVQGVSDTFTSVGDARELQAEVDELQSVIDNLTAQSVRVKEVEQENIQLRDLLNFVSANPLLQGYVGADVIGQGDLVSGQVVGQDPNPYIYYVIINRGDQDGVGVGMPVVSGAGRLVGRISEVHPRWSTIQLLIDPGSQIRGVVQVSRVTGLVTGQPDGSLIFEQIPQSEQVNVGETVVTTGRTGQGGLLPKGLIIGSVMNVERNDIDLYQRAALQPAVDFERLDLVLVITDFGSLSLDEDVSGETP
jgi:rod shape-determining protein MreC